jgi:hypothetical protein
MVKLPISEEPKEWKEYWKKELKEKPKIAKVSIKQGTWFTKWYWDKYKGELKSQGISWQNLMEAYGLSQYVFLKWIDDKESWENVINYLEERLNEILKYKNQD